MIGTPSRVHSNTSGDASVGFVRLKRASTLVLRRRSLPSPAPPVTPLSTLPLQAATDGYGGGFQEHFKNFEWEFTVINSPQVRRFCFETASTGWV